LIAHANPRAENWRCLPASNLVSALNGYQILAISSERVDAWARMVAIDVSPSTRNRKRPAALGQAAVVPQSVTGRMRKIKWMLLCMCLGVYYLTPLLR
jgi:hypothetical protein